MAPRWVKEWDGGSSMDIAASLKLAGLVLREWCRGLFQRRALARARSEPPSLQCGA